MHNRFQHAPEPESDIKTGRIIDENETTVSWLESCAAELKKIRSKRARRVAGDLSIIARTIANRHWQEPKHRWN